MIVATATPLVVDPEATLITLSADPVPTALTDASLMSDSEVESATVPAVTVTVKVTAEAFGVAVCEVIPGVTLRT